MNVTEPTSRRRRERRTNSEHTIRRPRHDAHATRAFTPSWR